MGLSFRFNIEIMVGKKMVSSDFIGPWSGCEPQALRHGMTTWHLALGLSCPRRYDQTRASSYVDLLSWICKSTQMGSRPARLPRSAELHVDCKPASLGLPGSADPGLGSTHHPKGCRPAHLGLQTCASRSVESPVDCKPACLGLLTRAWGLHTPSGVANSRLGSANHRRKE
jgi:hypothetical protein